MAWLTVRQAHARLSYAVSLTTVYRLVYSGDVEGTRVRGRVLLDEASLTDYVRRMGFSVICALHDQPSPQPAGRAMSSKEFKDRTQA